MDPVSYTRHRFPPPIIQHAIWLYLRFTLSYRDVEELLAERGLEVSYETVRRWVLKFGPGFARRLRRCRPAGHAEPCGFRPAALEVELRPREPVRPLRHRGVVLRKVFSRPVDVLVTGKDHERVAEKTNDIVGRQPDAAKPVRVGKVERRQCVPPGIGGSDRLENAVRL